MIWAQANQFDGSVPHSDLPPPEFSPLMAIFSFGLPLIWLVGGVFWLWMMIECCRSDPDRNFWVWILIFVPFGSAVYFFVRWLPTHRIRLPGPLRNFANRGQLKKLETAARQIGNPHQYVQWGDALKDAGMTEQADAAYTEALQKEPDNIQALWGLGQTLVTRSQYTAAKDRLVRVLEIDPQYKFGDVSLELARCQIELGEKDTAREHLDDHVRRWRHPESVYMLALLEADRDKTEAAKEHLNALILDVDGSPKGIARRNGIWRSKAKRMLKRL